MKARHVNNLIAQASVYLLKRNFTYCINATQKYNKQKLLFEGQSLVSDTEGTEKSKKLQQYSY